MLALDAKAELLGWESPPLLKVACLKEFARYDFPLERMVLDLRGGIGEKTSTEFLQLPWAGFLIDESTPAPAGRPTIRLLAEQAIVRAGDVVELRASPSKLAVRYRRGDNGNVLFATEQCNSFCLMCSQPPRMVQDEWRINQIRELVELIDKDEPSMAISGGEPTLLGEGLVNIIGMCADALPSTHIHVLSNGRRFDQPGFAGKFRSLHPSLTWGVPLYGDHFALHDYIVQSKGAFAQTIRGLYALHLAGQRIEIRVVLVKPTVLRLMELARFIYRNFPFVEHVALMGIEPIGFAKANRKLLWLDPADAAPAIIGAAEFLAERGLPVSLYNLPLCVIPRKAWDFARQSISNWKQHYLPACSTCDVKTKCGGFFGWVTPDWTSKAISPIHGETCDA